MTTYRVTRRASGSSWVFDAATPEEACELLGLKLLGLEPGDCDVTVITGEVPERPFPPGGGSTGEPLYPEDVVTALRCRDCDAEPPDGLGGLAFWNNRDCRSCISGFYVAVAPAADVPNVGTLRCDNPACGKAPLPAGETYPCGLDGATGGEGGACHWCCGGEFPHGHLAPAQGHYRAAPSAAVYGDEEEVQMAPPAAVDAGQGEPGPVHLCNHVEGVNCCGDCLCEDDGADPAAVIAQLRARVNELQGELDKRDLAGAEQPAQPDDALALVEQVRRVLRPGNHVLLDHLAAAITDERKAREHRHLAALHQRDALVAEADRTCCYTFRDACPRHHVLPTREDVASREGRIP
jgi:hypothetical protein